MLSNSLEIGSWSWIACKWVSRLPSRSDGISGFSIFVNSKNPSWYLHISELLLHWFEKFSNHDIINQHLIYRFCNTARFFSVSFPATACWGIFIYWNTSIKFSGGWFCKNAFYVIIFTTSAKIFIVLKDLIYFVAFKTDSIALTPMAPVLTHFQIR